MIDLIAEAVRLGTFLQSRGWRYCFIGGLAVQHWGEPRLTRDLDVSLLAGFGGESVFVDALLSQYAPRIPAAREFALSRRVLLLRTADGIGIDVSLAAIPYEERAVSRAVSVEMLPGSAVRLCSPEDLIVMKMFAGRDTDFRDVRSVIVRQRPHALDWPYIEENLGELAAAKDDPALLSKLRGIRDSVTGT